MTPEEEQRIDEELRRAGRAKELLGDELFAQAVKDIGDALIQGMKLAAFKDKDLVVALAQELRALDVVVSRLRTHIETGELAKEELKQKTIAEKAKEAWSNFTT